MKNFAFVLSVSILLMGFAVGVHAQEKIVMDGSTTVGPIAKAFAEYYMQQNPNISVSVSESGSGNGAKSLMNGACQVANMSRFMKENEFKAAVEKGVYPVAHAVALDGIAMILNPRNAISNLTLKQIKDIYMGKVTNWQQVGGPNLKIVVISRDTNSGTYETFENLVMQNEKIIGGAEYVGSNGAVRARVQKTPTAIGYVGLGFVDNTVKAIKVNEVMPSNQTISSGEYPIARPLYMFTDGYPKMGSHLYKFINLYLTKDGQTIIQEIGFIPRTNY